jgi:Beta-lactamase
VGAAGSPATPATAVSNDTRLWPAGYAWGSGADMAQFVMTLAAAGVVRGSDGLYRGVVDSALAPAVDVPGIPFEARYGLGMFVDRTPMGGRAWHAGNVGGFSALWRILPQSQIGVAVLVNRDGVQLDALADSALATVAAQQPGGAAEHSERIERAERAPRVGRREGGAGAASATLTREQAAALEGHYEGRFPIELRWSNGALRLTRQGTTLPLLPLGDDRYRVQATGANAPDVLTIRPATADHPAYVQMLLWAFVRRNP